MCWHRLHNTDCTNVNFDCMCVDSDCSNVHYDYSLHGDQSQSGESIKLTFLYASIFFYSTMFDVLCVKISLV